MKKYILKILAGFVCQFSMAQNPIVQTMYTADPSARVFGNRVYVFPSHDIPAPEGKGLRKDWFCMEDYHVFSSDNLVDWTDHGVIVTQNKVPWVKPDSYSMWAPDAIERNGRYYFYFPSTARDTSIGRGFTVGVAVAEKPEGPYVPQEKPVKGVKGIDPNVFIDKDGQAYLYWSQGNIYGAKLKTNMLELGSEAYTLKGLPEKGLKEGPYMFERNGLYYMTYPHVENKIERLEYAISNNPLGPFKFSGVIMDESPTGCWTNHHSILQFKNQWYLFYHHNDLSPRFDKNRSVRIDSLFFNADGTIKKIRPTLRGVGTTNAQKEIQLDRYSKIGGATIDFIDTSQRFGGWKVHFNRPGDWVQYNSVDFRTVRYRTVNIRVRANTASILQIKPSGNMILADVEISKNATWEILSFSLNKSVSNVHDLIATLKSGAGVDVDWIRFQ